MLDLFSFPEKYKVNITLEPKDYLKKANLTEREKSDLKILSNVEILYDLKFADGSESIVIGANLKYMKDKFTVQNIAKIIATSIPYLSIVVVKVGEIVKVAMLKSKPNQYDSGRRVVTEFTCTDEIRLDEVSVGSSDVLKQISDFYYQSSSSKEFNLKVMEIADSIKVERLSRDVLQERAYKRYLEERKRDAENFSKFVVASYDEDFDDAEFQFQTQYDVEDRFVTDCGNLGYGLFLEYSEKYYIDSIYEWIELYISICIEYAREMDIIDLSKKDIRKIIRIISNNEDYRENRYYSECIDIENFKDYIYDEIEFFADSDLDDLMDEDE